MPFYVGIDVNIRSVSERKWNKKTHNKNQPFISVTFHTPACKTELCTSVEQPGGKIWQFLCIYNISLSLWQVSGEKKNKSCVLQKTNPILCHNTSLWSLFQNVYQM